MEWFASEVWLGVVREGYMVQDENERDMKGWQPIATAPRDGTRIIGSWVKEAPGAWDAEVVHFDPEHTHWKGNWWNPNYHDPVDEPDWWMPIPSVEP